MSFLEDLLAAAGIDEQQLHNMRRQLLEAGRPNHDHYVRTLNQLTDMVARDNMDDHDSMPVAAQICGLLREGELDKQPRLLLAVAGVALAELTIYKRKGHIPMGKVTGHNCGCVAHAEAKDCADCGPYATCTDPRQDGPTPERDEEPS